VKLRVFLKLVVAIFCTATVVKMIPQYWPLQKQSLNNSLVQTMVSHTTSHMLDELLRQGLIRAHFPRHEDSMSTTMPLSEDPAHTEDIKTTAMDHTSLCEEVDRHPEELSMAENAADDISEFSLTDIVDYYAGYEVHNSPSPLDREGIPQALDDILNGDGAASDALASAEDSISSPEIENHPPLPASPNRSSQASEHRSNSISSNTTSSYTSHTPSLTTLPRPLLHHDGKSMTQRLSDFMRMVNDSERHCMRLIEEGRELQGKVDAKFLETLVLKRDIALLHLEKQDLIRRLEDVLKENAKLKEKVQLCDREHIFFN
jgi:hypothetical protein